ncbi:MAG TPA: hypothetical protein VFP34_04020 [Microlunatus sp.]|nr:hypothetical protein [Microlunatus sp.]
MTTVVEVYAVEPDNTTGSFLGFGSMLDPAIVFLHVAAPEPDPTPDPGPVDPGPVRPGPIRPGPIRPGPLRPAVPGEPVAAHRLQAEVPTGVPLGQDRARCRIRSGLTVLTLDGQFFPALTGVVAPRSVQLDLPFGGEIDVVDVPQGPGHPTAEEAAEVVTSFLMDAAIDDPSEPLQPPPSGPDVEADRRPHPGRRPWYCVICPGAWGC